MENVTLGVGEGGRGIHTGRLAPRNAIVPVHAGRIRRAAHRDGAKRNCTCASAVRVRRSCACTAIRSRISPGVRSRRRWRSATLVVLPDLRGYGASEIVPKRRGARRVQQARDGARHRRADVGAGLGAVLPRRTRPRSARRLPARPRRTANASRRSPRSTSFRRSRRGRRWITAALYGAYHWQFLAQPAPLPERLIGSDPAWYCRSLIGAWLKIAARRKRAALDAYCTAFARPGAVHAACEDYRAGYTCDAEADRVDRDACLRIDMPLLALWGAGDGWRTRTSPPSGSAGSPTSRCKVCAADTS